MAISITKPESELEFPIGEEIDFSGAVEESIERVEIWIDDRWLVGKVPVDNGQWSFPYRFLAGGTFIVYAKGFDREDNLIDIANIWVFIEAIVIPETPSLDVMLEKVSIPDRKLTANFSLYEFVLSPTANRLGLDNTPTATEIERLRRLCEQILQPAREALGPIRINSGFRSATLNKAVGGVPNSAHRLGHAADTVPTGVGTREFARWIFQHRPFDQIILEFGTDAKPDWIHVSADPRNRRQILRQTNAGTKEITL